MDRSRVVVMDELGRFDIDAPRFTAAVWVALDSRVPVVGVLKDESNPFIDRVPARKDARVIRLSPANRTEAEEELMAQIASRVGLPQDDPLR